MLDQTSTSLTTKIRTKTDLYPDSVLCPITRALGELFLEEPSLFDNSEEVSHCLVKSSGRWVSAPGHSNHGPGGLKRAAAVSRDGIITSKYYHALKGAFKRATLKSRV